MKRQIAIFILVNILLQSCRAYYPSSISLKEASENAGKVKVTTTQKDKFRFNQILLKDSIYYGVKSGDPSYSYYKEIPLDTAIISGVYEKNTKKSTWGTVFVTLGVIIILFAIEIGIELALY